MDPVGAYHVERRRSGYSLGWHRNYQTKPVLTTRGEVSAFSAASRRRLSRYIGNCRAQYRYLGTLTVRDWSPDGSVFKGQLDRYLVWFMRAQKRVAKGLKRAGHDPKRSSILWWLEFQARGAPHVHFIYTERVPWKAAAAAWARFIADPSAESSATRFEKIRDPQSMPAYLGKYAAKWEQKEVPEQYHQVGRFWGVRGYRKTAVATIIVKSGELQRQLEVELHRAITAEQERGNCSLIPWKFGDGVTIYPKKGCGDLEYSGVIERLELQIAKTIPRGEDYVLHEVYQRHNPAPELFKPVVRGPKRASE